MPTAYLRGRIATLALALSRVGGSGNFALQFAGGHLYPGVHWRRDTLCGRTLGPWRNPHKLPATQRQGHRALRG